MENNNESQPKKFSGEVKRHFLEIVSTYSKYQEQMDRKSDITHVAETLGGIIEAAEQLIVNEADGWFDKQTVKRNLGELKKLGVQFDKVVVEANDLDQRLNGLYEDMGHILSRYYKLGDINSDEVKQRLGITESKYPKAGDIITFTVASNRPEKITGKVIDDNGLGLIVKHKGKNLIVKQLMNIKINELVKLSESAMSELDVMAQEAKDFKSFTKDVYKEYPTMPKNTASVKWLEDIYNNRTNESINESNPVKGRKSFYTRNNVGSSKYTINNYDGKATHKDGSPFYGIFTFKNKKSYEDKKKELKSQGYIEESIRSVNENFSSSDIDTIKQVVAKEKRLIGLSDEFKKLGWYPEFIMLDSIPPHLKLKKKKNDKATFVLVNKKYVDKPDFVIGDIAGGLQESIEKKNLNINEGQFDLGKVEYTSKALTPTDIEKLAFEYLQTPISSYMGRSNDNRVRVFNDLRRLIGMDYDYISKKLIKGKSNALILHLLKTKLVTKDEYVKLYKQLVEKAKQVGKYVVNGSSTNRTGGVDADSISNAAARSAAKKDMKKLSWEAKTPTNESSNSEFKLAQALNKRGNTEMAFYDELEKLNQKLGYPKYMVWLANALKSKGIDMKSDTSIKNSQEAEETLYNLSK